MTVVRAIAAITVRASGISANTLTALQPDVSLLLGNRRAALSVAAEASPADNPVAMMADRTSRIGGWLAAIAFAFALMLSAAPQLHERFHHHADTPNHECAVTLVATGSFDHAATPPLLAEPQTIELAAVILNLRSAFVRSSFLSGSVFEHAPPVFA